MRLRSSVLPLQVSGASTPWLPNALILALIVVIGLAMRAVPVIGTGAPLNDGGLFVAMAEDIRRAGFALPETTSYNQDGLPFAYPPLGLYLLAALTEFTGIPAIQWIRFVPLVFATASIVLVYPVAVHVLGARSLGLTATMAFALLPRSYEWLIVGGGITRAPGLFLALGAINLALLTVRRPEMSVRKAVAAALVLGLAGLTHPEAAVFGGVSIALLVLSACPRRQGAAVVALVGLTAAIVVAPWIVIVLLRHGAEPFLAASESRNLAQALLRLASLDFTGAPVLPVVGILGAAGFVLEAIHGRYLLPGWIVLIFLTTPAAAATFSMLPWALLIASVANYVPRKRRLRNLLAAGAVLAFAIVSAYLAPLRLDSPLWALSDDERAAMAWIERETPADAQFLVVAGIRWEADASSEWFPVLAQRHSVGTPQGYEWTSRATWTERVATHDAAARCALDGPSCLDDQVAATGVDYVYIPKGPRAGPLSRSDCCAALRAALRLGPGYSVVYDGPGASIYATR